MRHLGGKDVSSHTTGNGLIRGQAVGLSKGQGLGYPYPILNICREGLDLGIKIKKYILFIYFYIATIMSIDRALFCLTSLAKGKKGVSKSFFLWDKVLSYILRDLGYRPTILFV